MRDVGDGVSMPEDRTEVARGFWGMGRPLSEAVAVVLIGIPVAVVIPFLFMRLIGRAQAACLDDMYPGQNFYLFVVWLQIVVVAWLLFGLAALIARRSSMAIRVGLGVVVVVGLCLFVTWQLVPWGESSDYAMTAVRKCGPGGIPTWWPPILPHH
jgi:hypothetical protein